MEKHGGLVSSLREKQCLQRAGGRRRVDALGRGKECQSDVEVTAWEEVKPPYALVCPRLS